MWEEGCTWNTIFLYKHLGCNMDRSIWAYINLAMDVRHSVGFWNSWHFLVGCSWRCSWIPVQHPQPSLISKLIKSYLDHIAFVGGDWWFDWSNQMGWHVFIGSISEHLSRDFRTSLDECQHMGWVEFERDHASYGVSEMLSTSIM